MAYISWFSALQHRASDCHLARCMVCNCEAPPSWSKVSGTATSSRPIYWTALALSLDTNWRHSVTCSAELRQRWPRCYLCASCAWRLAWTCCDPNCYYCRLGTIVDDFVFVVFWWMPCYAKTGCRAWRASPHFENCCFEHSHLYCCPGLSADSLSNCYSCW